MGICNCCAAPLSADGKPRRYIKQNYIIGKTLGKGASCRVVECTERATQEKYALKIMAVRQQVNKKLFEKEVEILQMLSHRYIISFKESHIDSSSYYLVTELCTGGELFDRIIDERNPITERKASLLIRTMLLAIEHCDSRQIVHRDIKPENFVFKTKSQESDMVLIDFGCAKIVEDDERYNDLLGTPFYLAPESAVGPKYVRTGQVLKSSDLWAIGVISFIFMTGQPPFTGKSNREIFSNIVKKPVKFPRHVQLSESFIDFCKNIMKKSPKRRMTLAEALKHPWITGTGTSSNKIHKDVIRVLRQFNQQSKLKKAITKVLSSRLGKRSTDRIRGHFDHLDKNNDGGLDAEELSILLMDMGFSENTAKKDAKTIITKTDENGSGKIEFDEFAQIWQRKMLTNDESYIHAVFQILDENSNGKIEATELANVLNLTGEENEGKIAEYIREVDTDKDGVISFKEFQAAMMETGKLDGSGAAVGYKLSEQDVISNTKSIAKSFDLDQVDF